MPGRRLAGVVADLLAHRQRPLRLFPRRGVGALVEVDQGQLVRGRCLAGAVALLHSGWRGTAARIVRRGIEALAQRGFAAGELRVHLGPAICGKCYEVGSDVFRELTGCASSGTATRVDLRDMIAVHAREAGVRHISTSTLCTRCDNERLFSHRAGDAGRQIAVIMADSIARAA